MRKREKEREKESENVCDNTFPMATCSLKYGEPYMERPFVSLTHTSTKIDAPRLIPKKSEKMRALLETRLTKVIAAIPAQFAAAPHAMPKPLKFCGNISARYMHGIDATPRPYEKRKRKRLTVPTMPCALLDALESQYAIAPIKLACVCVCVHDHQAHVVLI